VRPYDFSRPSRRLPRLEGNSAPDHAAATAMPSFGVAYTDAEIAAVANYAVAHFGGKQGQVTAEVVAGARP
jgi:mono/diheme cytochrome c family protein